MKLFTTYATRFGSIAVAAALACGFAVTGAQAQGTVTLSSGGSCSYSSITVQPNGNMAVTCSNTGPTTAPACTISGATNVSSGTPYSLTANCTPAATSYTWASSLQGFANPGTATIGGSLPDGTYTFTVTGTNSVGTGAASPQFSLTIAPPTVAPSCTVSAGSPITTGNSATLTATCNPSAASYAWTAVTAGAPAAPGNVASASVGPFATAGSYVYSVVGTNAVGAGTAAQATVVVNAPSAGCPATPGNAIGPAPGYTSLGNLRFDLKAGSNTFAQLGYQVLDWPNGSTNSMRISVQKGTSSESPSGLVTQVSVAPCPGQFVETTNPSCNKYVGTSGYLNIGDGTAASPSSCKLSPGKYYINVRFSSPTGVNTCGSPTNSPVYGYCTTWVKATNY